MKFEKNYKNFIQIHSILNNKDERNNPTCLGLKNIHCRNCMFSIENQSSICHLYNKVTHELQVYSAMLNELLSEYTSAEQLTYLIQADLEGIVLCK